MTQEVGEDEELARYVFSRRQIRADDTVRPEALMPSPRYPDMSVTRHLSLSEEQIWKIGTQVSIQRSKPLQGRLDLATKNLTKHELLVKADPLPDNKNHANVTNWPQDKSTQKQIALDICAEAGNVKKL
ncbi:MAG: hypothetical protein Q9M14_06675 [Mariprofundaceae bacterium]|nr:hypothetical protein [Mariprofundaceae bacterium]